MAKIKIKVAKNLKKQAKKVCEDLDLSLETVLNVFLLKLVEGKRIPFEVNEQLLDAARDMLKDKKDKDDKDKDEEKEEKEKSDKDDEDPALEDLEQLGLQAMKDKENNKKS